MLTKLLATAMAVALALPALARGAEQGAGTERASSDLSFIAFKLGGIVPTRGLDGFDPGSFVEGVGGFRVTRRFAVELALGRWAVSAEGPMSIEGLDATISSAVVTAFPLTVTGVVTVPAGPLQLHGLLGCGLQFTTAEAMGPYARARKVSSSPQVVHAGARGDARLARDARLGVEVKYFRESADLWATGDRRVVDGVTVQAALTYSL